jgi:Fe-S cluster assembly iron-binding protein IscA
MKKLSIVATLLLIVAVFPGLAVAAITVTVSPASVSLSTTSQQQFAATVSGTHNETVAWSVSGAGCSGLACGSISASGLYTAPASVPGNPVVTVSATSIVDGTRGTATVTIQSQSNIAISISPTYVAIAVKGQQQFTATVTGTSNHAVNWSISGIGCVGFSCGTVSSAGLYTAPATVPVSAIATVTATSVADPTKSASATVVIQSASAINVTISPTTALVMTGAQQQFTATVTGTTNSAVTWTLSGAGCSGATCGTITTNGLYTAPTTVPNPPSVRVTATSVADPARSATAIVMLQTGPAVTVSPASAKVQTGKQMQFTATVTGTNSQVVIWSVSGSGCSGQSCGSVTSNGLYTAPTTVPNPPQVAVTATLVAYPTISGSATVTITSPTPITVTVAPSNISVGTGAQQQFTATVTGTNNTAVTWSISGIGCVGQTCGTISQTGLYTAPPTPPLPSYLNVVATSVADTSKSGSATVIIVPVVGVTISPVAATLVTGAMQQFRASVSGSQNQTVTWSVAGTGCAGPSCGTISNNGLYTAPAAVPNPPTVKVTATAQADPSKSASAVVTVVLPIVVTVTPGNALVTVGTTQQFHATVTGTNNTAVTWSVLGTGCSQSACGTIDMNGLYQAPTTIPMPPTVNVIATSQANPADSGVAVVTIAATNNSKLNGQYAFLFRGFDQNGVYQAAGTFKADGQGNITFGLEDVNFTLGPATNVSFSGTYQVTGDNRGTMQITSKLGTFSYAFALNLVGKSGRFIESDATGIRGSGVMKLQDPSAFNTAALTGGYALSLSGLDVNGGRIAALGSIYPSGSGFISGSSLDVNDAGNVYPTFATFTGIYKIDVTSRGTMSLSVLGFGTGTLNFAFYVVSSTDIMLVSIDPLSSGQIFAGVGAAQTGFPYLNSSFQGTPIFNMTGVTGAFSEATVGRFSFDGTGKVSVLYDRNSGGKISIANVYAGEYDIQVNGRGVLTLVDPNNPLNRPIWYIYAIAPNRAFVMDASTSNVGLGEITPQAALSQFSNSDIAGNFFFGSGEPAASTVPLFSGTAYFDGGVSNQGKGNVSGKQDESTASSFLPNQTLLGTYFVSVASNNGRGSVLLTTPPASYALWVISVSNFVAIDVDASNPQPTVFEFEQ